MSSPVFPHIYEAMVNEDIAWIEASADRSLEMSHIISILKQSVKEYEVRGYMEAMCHEGPIYGEEKIDKEEQLTESEKTDVAADHQCEQDKLEGSAKEYDQEVRRNGYR